MTSDATPSPSPTVFVGALLTLPVLTLAVFDLVVIVGNSMVMVAVHTLPRLKATVNIFIVSLAASDLAIGLVVLPFSSAYEVLTYWPFGSLTCSAWLAVDVWLCTASILNLCAISFDRYLAVSRPFKYPELMSTRRSKILVCSVWCISFFVCLPPLVGWRERRVHQVADDNNTCLILSENVTSGSDPATLSVANDTINSSTDSLMQCMLTSERGYVVYSALTSFWIPAIVMLSFYWQIYRVAASSSAALRRGEIRTSTTDLVVPDSPNTAMTLRVHRGTSSPSAVFEVNGKKYSALPNGGTKSPNNCRVPRKQSSLDSALAPPRCDDSRRRGSAMSEQVTSRSKELDTLEENRMKQISLVDAVINQASQASSTEIQQFERER